LKNDIFPNIPSNSLFSFGKKIFLKKKKKFEIFYISENNRISAVELAHLLQYVGYNTIVLHSFHNFGPPKFFTTPDAR
jgi:hypothetical protein